jgi:hypothetical protein
LQIVFAFAAVLLLSGCISAEEAATKSCQQQGLTAGTPAFQNCFAETMSGYQEDNDIGHETSMQMILH